MLNISASYNGGLEVVFGQFKASVIPPIDNADQGRDNGKKSCSHNESLNYFSRFGKRPNESDRSLSCSPFQVSGTKIRCSLSSLSEWPQLSRAGPASRRFVALSAERLAKWMASDLSKLDLLIIQIDGLHIGNDLVLVAALGTDGNGDKHPLGLVEGATENTAVVQALIDNLIERGLDPTVCRLFIIDGAKALSKVIRRTFGPHTPIQRCQLHKAGNVIERLPKPLHASAAPSLGARRCRQGRAAPAQSRPQARPGGARRLAWPQSLAFRVTNNPAAY
jgi:hypothetical protein